MSDSLHVVVSDASITGDVTTGSAAATPGRDGAPTALVVTTSEQGNLPETSDVEAEVCLLLVCGLPGCGKTSFCRAIVEKFASLRQASFDCQHVCYDDLEVECRVALSNSGDKFDPAAWRLSRKKAVDVVRECVTKRSNDRTTSRLVLILDDNMYYRSMRRNWYHLAIENRFAFRQVFLQASVQTCLERNSGRPPISQVPEFSIRHMAEVFEWPHVSANSWEALNQASIILETDHDTTEQQVEALFGRWGNKSDISTCLQSPEFWTRTRAAIDQEAGAPEKQSSGHYLDLALRKVVTRAFAEAPKELAKARPTLAKRWSSLKATLVAEHNSMMVDTTNREAEDGSLLMNELEQTFLRACVADMQEFAAADPIG
eukprot:TRINITY_DN70256_c0_g1_i1.p1 TRINITY_DN70256_c0_g1~~TRINITY_DN70256_c0_g1_i1.p1  ORF type:complete len:373 (+),score=55.52 TRINITY_DN70256_c0_g1_i1:127-1245(+)